MARRHRIAARVTRSAIQAGRVSVRVATAPLVVVGWGAVLGVLYWQMLSKVTREKREQRARRRDRR